MNFDNLTTAIHQGIDRNLHTGVQVYASIDGQSVLDAGFGSAAPDVPMSASTIMLWRSAGKPITATAICRAWLTGQIDLDGTVMQYLPDTKDRPVGQITIQQMLTHTSGLPLIDTGWPTVPWNETLQRICRVEALSPGSAYQPQSTWFLLGAILESIDETGRNIQTILRDEVLTPLGIHDAWCGIDNVPPIADRLPQLLSREAGKLVPNDYGKEPWLTAPSPGGNFRGPIRELGKFYEMLLNGGETQRGEQLLSTATISAMTSRQRAGELDTTFQHIVDFGLGLIVDSNTYGHQTVPYGFSQYCSPLTFGHGGAQCSIGFCDPDRRLVVAWAANGFCGEGQHQRRNRAINDALYTDLGLI